MPFKEIKFKDIFFDPKVQKFCVSETFQCPNYNHSWACPPAAPYLEEEVSKFTKFFLVYTKFNMIEYIRRQKRKYPNRSEKRIRNNLYYKTDIREDLEKEVKLFFEDFDGQYKENLILWGGHCLVCEKQGYKNCSYDEGKPCRYPEKIRYSMEAVGIHVTNMVKALDLDIEWPPMNYYYRFALIALR
jgi:predicted metal-binding protein